MTIIKPLIFSIVILILLSGVAFGYPSQYTLESSNCAITGGSVVMKSSVASSYTIQQVTPANEASSPDVLTWSTSPDFTTDGANNPYLIDAQGANYYPFHAALNSNVDACLDVGLLFTPIGAAVTWDKSTYNLGDTATIHIVLNPTYFNTASYRYTFTITDPVTLTNEVYPLTSSSTYVTYTMTNVGQYATGVIVRELEGMHGTSTLTYTITTSYAIAVSDGVYSFIKWQPTNYTVGSQMRIDYGISNSYLDSIYSYSVKIYKDNTQIDERDYLDNFGTLYYTSSAAGNYRVDLIKSAAYVETVMKSASATVIQPSDTITTDKTSYNTSETIFVTGVKYPAKNEKSYSYVVISNGQSLTGVINTAQVQGVSPYTFALDYNLPVGSYYASLYGTSSLNDCSVTDNPSVCYKLKDYRQFTVTAPNNASSGHPDLNISWGAAQYKLWESAHFSYQNATYNDTVQIIDNLGTIKYQFKTSDQGIGTLYSGTQQIDSDPKYIGTWTAKIINGSNSANYKTSTMQVISASQANYTNDFGVIMNWDQPIGSPGKHTLTWNTGIYSGTYEIKLIDGINGNFIMTLPFATGSTKAQQYTFTLGTTHKTYTAQFINSSSIVLSSASIEISNLGSPGVTIPAGSNPMQQKTDEFLGSGMMISFIILMIFIGGGYMFGGLGGVAIGTVSGVSFCVYYEMLPVWILFLVAIVTILMFSINFGGKLVGGGSE